MVAGQALAAVDVDGEWLYRQGDLVLGPVAGSYLVERLYAGDLTPDTPVAPMGERDFHRMADVDAFRTHVARAEAQSRVNLAVIAERERAKKRMVVLGGIAAVAALVLGGVGLKLARDASVHGWFGEEEYGDIEMDPPVIRLAQARRDEEELFEYPGAGGTRQPDRAGSTKPATGTGSTGRPAVASRTPARVTNGAAGDAEGMEIAQQFDQSAINRVVASSKSTLFRCFKEEAERSPGLTAKIPLEFVIGNDGKVAKLWVDNPQFKKGPLYDCLFTELQRWPFRAYEGERATVGLSFNIGKRG